MRKIVLAAAVILLPQFSLLAQTDYAAVEANVTFESVMALPYRDSDQRLFYGDDPLQYGRLWLANPVRDRQATVIFVHGGCWLNSFDMSHSFALATALADAGYTVWSLEYRRSGDAGGGWPGSYRDIQAGINYLAEIPGNQPLGRVGLAGHSAGGHLALLAGSQEEQLNQELDLVVGLAAITDVIDYAAGSNSCQSATGQFMGGAPDNIAEAYRLANPASHGSHGQTLLLHGAIDTIVPLSQTGLLDVEVVVNDSAGHFDWVHPGTPAFRQLLELLDARL